MPDQRASSGEAFAACPICASRQRQTVYSGPIRVGRFGAQSTVGDVVRCLDCGTARLASAPVLDYAKPDYRILVDGSTDTAAQRALHDPEQLEKLNVSGTANLRGKVVADIGASVGSFLDMVRGVAASTIAVEPAQEFHQALSSSGHRVYAFAEDAHSEWSGKVDVAVSFSVIEHVEDPVGFLKSIRKLLKAEGKLLVSTPNLDDWLLELLPDSYAAFYYRVVHRWYFDAASLQAVARRAGFSDVKIQYVHRFDLSNLLVWLRDRRPSGRASLEISPFVDASFVRWLESSGRSDYMYAWLSA